MARLWLSWYYPDFNKFARQLQPRLQGHFNFIVTQLLQYSKVLWACKMQNATITFNYKQMIKIRVTKALQKA
jgi:hypothetical protein